MCIYSRLCMRIFSNSINLSGKARMYSLTEVPSAMHESKILSNHVFPPDKYADVTQLIRYSLMGLISVRPHKLPE